MYILPYYNWRNNKYCITIAKMIGGKDVGNNALKLAKEFILDKRFSGVFYTYKPLF